MIVDQRDIKRYMPVSHDTYQRLKEKGLSAYKAGRFAEAKPFLMQAADAMIQIAAKTTDPAMRARRSAMAAELIDFAKSCDQRRSAAKQMHKAAADSADTGQSDASDWVVREKPGVRFDDIAGLDEVKQEIRLKMIYPFTHPELAQRYQIIIGGGLLLYGPPGTGKTMMAKAIASEIDATMYVISPAQILSKWVGEAEQNIRKLFSAARQEDRAVIFIDEIEALVPLRSDSQSGGSSVMARVVPQILQEIEGFDRSGEDAPLLFVGATNVPWNLDPAILRPGRFDAKCYIPLPDAPARFRLLEIYFGERPLAGDVDFAEWVEQLAGYSGADIKALAAKAASIPFMDAMEGKEPRTITRADILEVIGCMRPSVRPSDLIKYEAFIHGG